MIVPFLAKTILALSLFQLFPVDAGVIEERARLPVASPRLPAPGLYDTFSLTQRSLPLASKKELGPTKVDATSLGVMTTAASAIVVDRVSGEPLFQKNIDTPRSIGSISKLMTAYVFLEGKPDLAASVSITAEDVRTGGVQHIRIDDLVTVRDLLLASLIGSDNTATAALVRLSRMAPGDFVARMNETASELGLHSTTFVDPTGLSFENRSTALDIVRLLDVTMQVSEIKNATELPRVTIKGSSGRVYLIENTNELLGGFLNSPPYKITGGKTGFLPEAGYCFGSIITENNAHELIVVVLGSETKHGRFQDAKALALWAYKVFEWPDEAKITAAGS